MEASPRAIAPPVPSRPLTWEVTVSSASPGKSGTPWPPNNPIVDDHIVHALTLAAPALAGAGGPLGPDGMWERLRPVERSGSWT
jgi:hypothetical protein